MLSIIIITKNEEKYLPLLLESIKKQDFSDYEIIVCDNSTDNTLKIAKNFGCIVTKSNNPSNGRNNGAKLAKGEILIFIDSDMVIQNTSFLSDINTKMQNNFIGGTCNIRIKPEEEKTIDIIVHTTLNKLIQFLLSIGFGTGRGGCQIIKKAYFEKYDENITVGEDVELFRRLRKKGKIKFLDLIIFESRRRYNKLGYINVFYEWIKSGISNFIFGKKYNKERIEIR